MAGPAPSDRVVHLLWTGGWDSTFALVRLLLDQRRPVQPYYLLDAHRPSTDLELLTLERIRDHLFERYSHTRDLLAPVKQFVVADIAPDDEITAAYRVARRVRRLGRQYDWLPRFCRQQGITDMHIGFTRLPRGHWFVERQVALPDETTASGKVLTYRLDPDRVDPEVVRLFSCFRFPILDLTKVDMNAIVRRRGWTEIMALTWFCQRPLPGPRPCGTCHPCGNTIKEGLGWRVPLTSRARYVLHWCAIPTAKNLAKGLLRAVGLR